MRITLEHLHTIPARGGAGYCNRGARPWFARHGLDWTAFVKHGIDERALLATGDGFAAALVDWAHQCAAREQACG